MIVDWLFNLNAWCVALISLTTYYILAVVAHWRKFRHLPNAGFNPFTAFIETFRNFDRFNDMLLEHTLKFGQKTWAMSPPGSTSMAYIMVTDPQCVEHILKTNFDNYIKVSFRIAVTLAFCFSGFADLRAFFFFNRAQNSPLDFTTFSGMGFSIPTARHGNRNDSLRPSCSLETR
jgi:hypothetical protein